MSRLQNGQQFPSLPVPAVGGGAISLPDDLAGFIRYVKEHAA